MYNTAIHALPAPDQLPAGAGPDVPADVKALADAIDTKLTPYVTAANFGALPAVGKAGRRGRTTDNGMVYLDTGAAWVVDNSAAGNGIAISAVGVHTVDLAATPGLEFSAGKLRAAVDGTTIERTAGGVLGVKDGGIAVAKIADALKPSGGAAAGTEALRALGTTAGTAAAGNDGRFPTAGEKTWLTDASDGTLTGAYDFTGAVTALSLGAASHIISGVNPTISATAISVGNRAATFLNLRVTGEANNQFILANDGKMSWGPGGATALDTVLYRQGAATMKTDGWMYATNGFRAYDGSSSRTQIGGLGPGSEAAITFGSANDAVIYRTGSAALRTSGTWTVDGAVTHSSTLAVTSDITATTMVKPGGSATRVIYSSDNSANYGFGGTGGFPAIWAASSVVMQWSSSGAYIGTSAQGNLIGSAGTGYVSSGPFRWTHSHSHAADQTLMLNNSNTSSTGVILRISTARTASLTSQYLLDVLNGSISVFSIRADGATSIGCPDANNQTLTAQMTNAAYAHNGIMSQATARGDNSGYNFLTCNNTAGNRFYVRGDGVIFAANTTVQSVSDKRLKKNIVTLDDALDKILGLRPVEFDWRDEAPNTGHSVGFIAQEVEEVLPDAVDEWVTTQGKDGEKFKSVGQGEFIPYLVGAIQKLEQRVAELEAA